MASGQLFIAILNPGVEITPLKLRGWLQREARQVSARAQPGDGAILRLFLTPRLRYAFTGEKLDALLQDLTERYPVVLRIETRLVDAPLSQDDMEAAIRQANQDLQKFIQRAENHARQKQAEAAAQPPRPQPIQWHTLKSALDE